ncbi:MAG: hypothetical protein ACJ74Z_10540 [Bryobacteraceae bacterium]
MSGNLEENDLFSRSKSRPTLEEEQVGRIIDEHTREHPIEAAEIASRKGYSKRMVTAIVEKLRREHGLPIGASRRRPSGFFMARSNDDFEATLQTYLSQIHSMVETVRAVAPRGLRGWVNKRLRQIAFQREVRGR